VRLVYQRREPQHFEGGAFNASRHRGQPAGQQCQPLSGPSALSAGEDASLIPLVRSLGGITLETHSVSSAAWWAHSHAGSTASRTADCTHWCLTGVPAIWAAMLLQLLRHK